MEKQKNAVGRRKEAVTRVFLSKGDGKIMQPVVELKVRLKPLNWVLPVPYWK